MDHTALAPTTCCLRWATSRHLRRGRKCATSLSVNKLARNASDPQRSTASNSTCFLKAPGEVFRCFEQAGRCPGGRPGTCAPGRDNQSIACAACLPGLHTTGDTCEVCSEGNYAMLALVGILCGSGISVLYVVLVYEGQKSRQPGSLLIAALSMGQMVTVVQQLTVIQQFKIEWGSPFSDILAAMELLAFDLDMVSISCVAPMSPVAKFTTRTLLVLLFFAMAGLVHVGYLAYKRAKTLQLGLLGRTVGTLFMVFFISLCSSLLAPFRCNMHPNGRWTVQTYHQVVWKLNLNVLRLHHQLVFAGLLPICFVVICIWIILFELPKRLERADVHFIRACSFLFIRFRPGAEVFSVIFLVRNALVVLCPLLPSAAAKALNFVSTLDQVVCMNILLYGSVVVTAFSKPWRVMACNFLDLLLVTGMLVILDMGSLFVQQENTVVTTVICMAFFSIMLVAIFGAILYGIAKHFLLKYRKQFRFFLCHQKVAAGSLARLLKMELQKRGSRFTTFVDCDDLNDLTRLFSYVGQDTETLVVLASPDILTRKWCVGEICTARIQRVETVVVAFPEYANPDKTFIESYSSIVPDITELANYNLGLVAAWFDSSTFKAKSTKLGEVGAYIMLGLLLPKLVGGSHNSMPTVLKKDGVFGRLCAIWSADVASNLLAVKDLKTCCILPIIAEDAPDDGFRFPSQAFYEDLVTNRQLSSLDLQSYVQIIKVVWRLQSGDLKPLSSKLATEVSEPSPEPSVEQPLKPLGQAEQVPKVDERSDLVETANAPPMPDKIETELSPKAKRPRVQDGDVTSKLSLKQFRLECLCPRTTAASFTYLARVLSLCDDGSDRDGRRSTLFPHGQTERLESGYSSTKAAAEDLSLSGGSGNPIVVMAVASEGPARRAGVLAGYQLIALNGRDLTKSQWSETSAEQLLACLASTNAHAAWLKMA
ncbi:40S ribosomal protein S6 [Durusdinium trenchii]|uniref:40S ribosomal protein S6 n=1 Tax=Durusdinium trenchii TaxID=1381693 RepID=A0ABP0KAL8_9DINO